MKAKSSIQNSSEEKWFDVHDELTNKTLQFKAKTLDEAISKSENVNFEIYEDGEKVEHKPYAISTSDGHEENWTYYDSKKEAKKAFKEMKKHESDIHLYEYNSDLEYEVIDSFWEDEK